MTPRGWPLRLHISLPGFEELARFCLLKPPWGKQKSPIRIGLSNYCGICTTLDMMSSLPELLKQARQLSAR